MVTLADVRYDKIMSETMPLTDQQDFSGVPGLQSVAVPGQIGAWIGG